MDKESVNTKVNLKVGSPNQVAESLRQDGYLINATVIRNWVKSGIIPCNKSGTKMYVSKDLIKYKLEYGESADISQMTHPNNPITTTKEL